MSEPCCGTGKAEKSEKLVSPVEFAGRSRVHIAVNARLNVFDMAPFYQALFGVEPTTLVEKYAKFEVDDPPVNLTINEYAENARGEAVFGVQVSAMRLLTRARERLERAGFPVHPRSNRGFWAADPDGNRWELCIGTPEVASLL
ncbi:VOC family protein [Aquabacterium sp. A7-Y]|uniref:VOC family protein n=1 Tax=Aquabacterium sp. A7-Y TaxID=1349605 RepID=UPI00223C93EC|nr:VOC family protein [Aquabacterium sp. A7-Y]MCW7541008.1 VOC family protein [Aquabacterium sp. A7-Y]